MRLSVPAVDVIVICDPIGNVGIVAFTVPTELPLI